MFAIASLAMATTLSLSLLSACSSDDDDPAKKSTETATILTIIATLIQIATVAMTQIATAAIVQTLTTVVLSTVTKSSTWVFRSDGQA